MRQEDEREEEVGRGLPPACPPGTVAGRAGARGGLVQRRIDAQRGRWIAEYQRELASIMARAGLI